MQKIMFNDKYGLTQAVLVGGKTQTRRMVTLTMHKQGPNGLEEVFPDRVYQQAGKWKFDYDGYTFPLPKKDHPRYKVGEVVAVAQSYADIGIEPFPFCEAGWQNKMFVKAEMMPHQIKITNVRIQRLQDISDEDCMAEGVIKIVHNIPTQASQSTAGYYPSISLKKAADRVGWGHTYSTPQYAYAALIDKVSGKDTWESNPWVFVYEFELVK